MVNFRDENKCEAGEPKNELKGWMHRYNEKCEASEANFELDPSSSIQKCRKYRKCEGCEATPKNYLHAFIYKGFIKKPCSLYKCEAREAIFELERGVLCSCEGNVNNVNESSVFTIGKFVQHAPLLNSFLPSLASHFKKFINEGGSS